MTIYEKRVICYLINSEYIRLHNPRERWEIAIERDKKIIQRWTDASVIANYDSNMRSDRLAQCRRNIGLE